MHNTSVIFYFVWGKNVLDNAQFRLFSGHFITKIAHS